MFRFCQGWAGSIESIPGLTRGLAGKWKRHDVYSYIHLCNAKYKNYGRSTNIKINLKLLPFGIPLPRYWSDEKLLNKFSLSCCVALRVAGGAMWDVKFDSVKRKMKQNKRNIPNRTETRPNHGNHVGGRTHTNTNSKEPAGPGKVVGSVQWRRNASPAIFLGSVNGICT